MRRLLLVTALAVSGFAGATGTASAQDQHWGPSATSVTWPSVTPSGWYTNTYNHAWYYPWYAYYNSSQGPYANWMAGGGYATYSHHGPAGHFNYPREVAQPYLGAWYKDPNQPTDNEKKDDGKKDDGKKDDGKKEKTEGRVSVTLPADAKLLFNGTVATGTGAVRVFRTPALEPGQSYRYELTAEVVRNGRTERVTESVVVRAGETSTATLTPPGVTTAGTK